MSVDINNFYGSYELPPLMTREEELSFGYKLSSQSRKERKKAQDEFITRNLRLVMKIARGYERCGVELEDMIYEGNIGLMDAAKRYDPDKGTKFSTYAALWIKQKIMRLLCNHGRLIRLPVQLVQIHLKIIKHLSEHRDKYNTEPSNEEIAKAISEPIHLVEKVLNSNYSYIHLDAPNEEQPENKKVSIKEIIPDSKSICPSEFALRMDDKDIINKFLSKLSARERYIIEHRFGLNNKEIKTLENIGEIFNVTRERIRQVEFEVMRKLRFAIQKEYKI